ncbi:MAG: hypothetical protein AAF533_06345 [Acidobacteriota bacterium]
MSLIRILKGAVVLGAWISVRALAAPCDPTPPPTGTTVDVATESELQDAVRNLTSGTTILIADGDYTLTNTLVIDGVSDVAIRSASGNREAVILRGRGMNNSDYWPVPHVFLVQDVTNLLIADLTAQDVWFHAVQVAGEHGPSFVTLRNLHLKDAGEQLVKGSSGDSGAGLYADDCRVECCLIEFTDRARSFYTNGVDVLAGARWVVADNVFRNIRAPVGELAGPTVLFWRNSIDTIVERNLFLECDRGVALGLSTPDPSRARDGDDTYDHQGGIVRNNMFYRSAGSPTGDVGLAVAHCRDYSIVHNTVLLNGSFDWTIEYRFAVSDGVVANNLTDGRIAQRGGASGMLAGNVTTAVPADFVDAAGGDLHLAPGAATAIDAAVTGFGVASDYDGESRSLDAAPDVGADELVACVLPAEPLTGLRLTRQGDDVLLTWDLGSAPLTNVWHVTRAEDGDLTRLASSPPAVGVAGCAEPDPAPGDSCLDLGAVSREPLLFYRVRSSCGGAAEGP